MIKIRKGGEPFVYYQKIITVPRYQMIECIDNDYAKPFVEYADGVVYDWLCRNL